jgi:hypothetical protein
MIETDTNVECSTAVERQHCSHSGGPEHSRGAHTEEPVPVHPEEWLTPLVPYARVNWKAVKRLG